MDGGHGRATSRHERRVNSQLHGRFALLLVRVHRGHGQVGDARQLNALVCGRLLHGIGAVVTLGCVHRRLVILLLLLLLLVLLHLILLHGRRLAGHGLHLLLHVLHGLLHELPLLLGVVHLRLSGKERFLEHLRLLELILVACDVHGRHLEVGIACEDVGRSETELGSSRLATIATVARERRKLDGRAIVVRRTSRDG